MSTRERYLESRWTERKMMKGEGESWTRTFILGIKGTEEMCRWMHGGEEEQERRRSEAEEEEMRAVKGGWIQVLNHASEAEWHDVAALIEATF